MISALVPQPRDSGTRLDVRVRVDMNEHARLLVRFRQKSCIPGRLSPVGALVPCVVQLVIRCGQIFAVRERTLQLLLCCVIQYC